MKSHETNVLLGAAVSRKLQIFTVAILTANGVPTVSKKQWNRFLGAVGAHAVQSSSHLPSTFFANHITFNVEQVGEHYWLTATTEQSTLTVNQLAWEQKFSVVCKQVSAQKWRFQFA